MLIPKGQVSVLVDGQQVALDASIEGQVIQRCFDLWKDGRDGGRLERSDICQDAYDQNFRGTLSEEESFTQDNRVFLPYAPTIADSVTTTTTNLLFPSNRYLRVEADLVGDFYARAATTNLTKTNFIGDTEEAVLEAAITGWLAFQLQYEGNFTKVVPICGADFRMYPTAKNMAAVNKMILVRKTALDMEDGQVAYIQESVVELEKNVTQVGDENQGKQKEVANTNPFKNSEGSDTRYGAGHILYECHIPKLKLDDGRVLRNLIAVVSENRRQLVRLTQVPDKDKAHSINGLSFSNKSVGKVYSNGVVYPILPIQKTINSMAVIELIGGLLDSMGGVSYNWADRTTRQLAGRWKLRPYAKWPATLNSNIQPIPRSPRRPFGQEVYNWFTQQGYILTNTQTAASGADSRPEFARIAQQQEIAMNGKSASHARHWDGYYIQWIASKVIDNIYDQMFPIYEIDPQSGMPLRYRNDQAIMWWMQQAGYTDQDIYMKFYDQRFMQQLAKKPDLTSIIPIGTRSIIERAQSQQELRETLQVASSTPVAQYTNWLGVTEQLFINTGVNNPEKLFFGEAQIQQMTMEQQAQGGNAQGQPQANPQQGQQAA